MIICTTATLSHFPYVLELARSVRQHLPEAKIVLGLLEEHVPTVVARSHWIDEIILAKDLPIPNFRRFVFRLTRSLGRNSIKAQLMQHLLDRDPRADTVIYADCYLKFYSSIPEVLQTLLDHPIALTPHLIHPAETESYEREMLVLNDGIFHSGFVAVKRNDEAKDFVSWWADKLNQDIRDPYPSDFFDQKWLNFCTTFYNVGWIKHPGYQVGFWNFHEPSRRAIRLHENGGDLLGGQLRCMNFSNENQAFHYYVDQLTEEQSKAYKHFREHYEQCVRYNDHYGFSQNARWSYDYYSNGEQISVEARKQFRETHFDHAPDDPFEWNNRRFLDAAERK